MVRNLIRNQAPGNRLRVRIPCPPLRNPGLPRVFLLISAHVVALSVASGVREASLEDSVGPWAIKVCYAIAKTSSSTIAKISCPGCEGSVFAPVKEPKAASVRQLLCKVKQRSRITSPDRLNFTAG